MTSFLRIRLRMHFNFTWGTSNSTEDTFPWWKSHTCTSAPPLECEAYSVLFAHNSRDCEACSVLRHHILRTVQAVSGSSKSVAAGATCTCCESNLPILDAAIQILQVSYNSTETCGSQFSTMVECLLNLHASRQSDSRLGIFWQCSCCD